MQKAGFYCIMKARKRALGRKERVLVGMARQTIEGKSFGEERALYGSSEVLVKNCSFDGAEDGESALKESRDVRVENVYCNLRYPFWHDVDLEIKESEMTEKCRAALWYCEDVRISDCTMNGVKALRECGKVSMERCTVNSTEFGWFTRGLRVRECTMSGEYFLLQSRDVDFSHVTFTGKYSFQYVKNAVLENCTLDTKDAFWHAENVTLRNCTVKGEYLAWYAKNLTMIDCEISGTQPFCYCENLRLINCKMTDADLAFEKSTVEAKITTPVVSIKNPTAGRITVPTVGELIMDDPAAKCEIVVG